MSEGRRSAQQKRVRELLVLDRLADAVRVGDRVAFENREGEVLVGRVHGADRGALDVLVPPNEPRGTVRNFRVARSWAVLIAR